MEDNTVLQKMKKKMIWFEGALNSRLRVLIAPFLTYISPTLNTKWNYFMLFRKRLDLKNPKTFNEKILWLKLNTYLDNPLVKQCADKYTVRDYIKNVGCSELLNELIGAYRRPEDIPWDELPDRFALKLNCGCGCNLIVTDKTKLDRTEIMDTLLRWKEKNKWVLYSEMQYKDVPNVFLVEKYLGTDDGQLPVDYKFYCFNGTCRYVMLCTDREIGRGAKFFYFDREWNMMPFTQEALDNPSFAVKKPELIDEAFEYAEKLSKDFPFVRVDLYIVSNHIYFGELTFTPSAGLDSGRMPSTDLALGNLLQLE